MVFCGLFDLREAAGVHAVLKDRIDRSPIAYFLFDAVFAEGSFAAVQFVADAELRRGNGIGLEKFILFVQIKFMRFK